jgi:hypothetical protein
MGDVPKQIGGRKTYAANFIDQDNDRGVFLGSAMADNLYSALLTVAAEVWALRRRCLITELLHERHGAVTREMIETYKPTAEEEAGWKALRDDFVNLTWGAFLRRKDIPYTTSLQVDKAPID